MLALIDGDLVCYRCAASAEGMPFEIAAARTEQLLYDILYKTQSERQRIFIGSGENFRYQIDPNYKANRVDKPAPMHLTSLKEMLVVKWKAELCPDIESDDAMGIAQCTATEETVICSLDKDLLQIPGLHFQWEISGPNWVRPERWHNVSVLEGLRTFYASSLIGDISDNIVGVSGIGPKKSAKLLESADTEQELFDRCHAQYDDTERFLRNLKLLWVLREEGKVYDYQERGLTLGMDTSTG